MEMKMSFHGFNEEKKENEIDVANCEGGKKPKEKKPLKILNFLLNKSADEEGKGVEFYWRRQLLWSSLMAGKIVR